jgi:hypothetical protein
METLYFIMGALSVVAVAAVVSVFTIKKQIKLEVEQMINRSDFEIHRLIEDIENNLNRRIDDVEKDNDSKENKLIDYADTLHNNLYEEMNKLYGYVDSRNDKLSDSLSKHIADIYKSLTQLIENDITDVTNRIQK